MVRNRSFGVPATLALMLAASAASAAEFEVLHRFRGRADGETPLAGLVADNHGNLYGTTSSGGSGDFGKNCSKSCGGSYTLVPSGGIVTFFTFNGKNGNNPTAPLLFLKDSFYGTTVYGGSNNQGVVFKLKKDGNVRVLYSFCSQSEQIYCPGGALPISGMIVDSADNFYGTTFIGGVHKLGTVFRLAADGTETALYSFCSRPNCIDGAAPTAGLVKDSGGNFYGTTQYGGGHEVGVAFKLAPDGTETVLHTFCSRKTICEDGNTPMAPLVMDGAGNLYGTTNGGGRHIFYGTVFKITPDGKETVLHSFCPDWPACSDGANPEAGLTLDSAGNLYGTTWTGGGTGCGGYGCGVVFKLAPDGRQTVLHAFNYKDGSSLQTAVLLLQGDYLYGTAPEGGRQCNNLGFGCGTVFKVKTE